MTTNFAFDDTSTLVLFSTAPIQVSSATVYPLKSIWTTPEKVRAAPRIYK